MLPITPPKLKPSTAHFLQLLQANIDSRTTYQEQVERAQSLWTTKESRINRTLAEVSINDLKADLKKTAIGNDYCNYCEHGEISDIEYIYPRSLYPNKTFVPENYLYACKKCNSGHKLAKFAILNPNGSTTIEDITPQYTGHPRRRVYNIPANEDALLINPRSEDPMEFLFLDLSEGMFIATPLTSPLSPRAKERIKYTLTLLELNSREGLTKERLNKFRDFYAHIEDYIAEVV